jgi:hypothetical protein
MEYATNYGSTACKLTPPNHYGNYGYDKFVGYDATVAASSNFQYLWEPERMKMYQQKITQLLEGVGPNGRPIIVPLDKIGSVLYTCFETNKPTIGDIYSRYIIPETREDIAQIVDRMINIIVSTIRNEFENNANNQRLTVWNSLLGDFNEQGLRAHAPIKLRKNRIPFMQFNMNY